MPNTLPLPTLLSQALVAFTIEHDNEWERRFAAGGPIPVVRTSLVMWSNFLRLVGDSEAGVSVRDLSFRAGYPQKMAHPSLPGMTRWGYVTVELDPHDNRGKPPKLDLLIRATKHGLRAAELWKPLAAEIEQRWSDRFPSEGLQRLRDALLALICQFDKPLPQYLLVLRPADGMRAVEPHEPEVVPPPDLALSALLSQVLHAFALDFEHDTDLSLALRANVLRVLDEEGVHVRELPRLSGTSKEAIAMATGFLQKSGHVDVGSAPDGVRGKVVRLTPSGRLAQRAYGGLVAGVEARWVQRFGKEPVAHLRTALASLMGQRSLLLEGLELPDPLCWRAQIPKPDVLPHHPMVLHRGGWPDGS